MKSRDSFHDLNGFSTFWIPPLFELDARLAARAILSLPRSQRQSCLKGAQPVDEGPKPEKWWPLTHMERIVYEIREAKAIERVMAKPAHESLVH